MDMGWVPGDISGYGMDMPYVRDISTLYWVHAPVCTCLSVQRGLYVVVYGEMCMSNK